MLRRYLVNLSRGRLTLWCYFIWYCVVLVRYFDPNPRLWLTSFGLSLIIGLALYLSTTSAGPGRVSLGFWPILRFFLMPFCVSSFSALAKNKGFFLVFSPRPGELLTGALLCALLWGIVKAVQASARTTAGVPAQSADDPISR